MLAYILLGFSLATIVACIVLIGWAFVSLNDVIERPTNLFGDVDE